MENAEVARILREMADVLELQSANPFRVRAYRNAARTVEELPAPLTGNTGRDVAQLVELPGIGEDLAGKIAEIARTGSLRALRKASREVPAGAIELLRLPGIGPKRARLLAERLGVRSLGGLARAVRTGALRGVKGFGGKTEARLLQALAAQSAEGHRTLRAQAAPYADAIAAHLRELPGVHRVEVAGSFRRGRETVGDLDLVASAASGVKLTDRFVAIDGVASVLGRGTTKASVLLRSGLQVDLRVVPDESYGSALLYLTGSKAHNIALRGIARGRGLKINEYGVFRGDRRLAGRTETGVYRSVGLPWIPPELREQRGEIEAARAGALPRLLEAADLRGDLHAHTTSSDGREGLEAMANAAEARGYEYLAITDHTTRVKVVGGLDRSGFRRQMRRIDALNARLRSLTVLKGAEVDINPDGTLDLDDATLAELDVVVVSVHSAFGLPPAEQTRRVLRALSHPSVDIFGHPTGRLLSRRSGVKFDLDAVCRMAAERGLMLEVNAQPERLDLDDVACRAAIANGVRLVVSTDAHSTAELNLMRWGVDQARRGWVERRNVANTLPLSRLQALLHGRR
jgi:DNA polymerase (family 10)